MPLDAISAVLSFPQDATRTSVCGSVGFTVNANPSLTYADGPGTFFCFALDAGALGASVEAMHGGVELGTAFTPDTRTRVVRSKDPGSTDCALTNSLDAVPGFALSSDTNRVTMANYANSSFSI